MYMIDEKTVGKPKVSPKDFFMHVLSMIALYGAAISFGMVIFALINRWLPDLLQDGIYYPSLAESIRNSISVLIVFFPVYLWVMWTLHKEYEAHAEKRNLRVRKWLTYLTLFVAGVIVMIDGVTLVRYLLGGELTLRFILKVLTVLLISGSIFVYYRWDLKKYSIE